MEAPRARRTDRGRGGRGPADLDLRPVRRRRRLRHPAAPRHQGRVRRADAARAWRRSSTPAAAQMFDDETEPTSLAFSDDSTRDALERSLELFRSPTLTLTEEQLEPSVTPLEWFKRGKLGMIEGYREPGARPAPGAGPGLRRDRDAGPRAARPPSARSPACACPKDAASAPAAADFMVHLLDTPAGGHVARAGYLVPGEPRGGPVRRLPPARPPARARPGRSTPASATSSSRRCSRPGPSSSRPSPTSLDQLFSQPILDNLDELTEQIDEESRTVLDPEFEESPSPDEDSS